MTRREALSICEEALSYHDGGKEAYLDLIEDLLGPEECDNVENTKEILTVNTSEGLLIAESYDDGCAKGVNIRVNENAVAIIDVTNDGEIRLLGYKEQCDEPSFYYSVNR